MTKQEYTRAMVAGESARRAGDKRHTCPAYGVSRDAQTLREAWLSGWDDEDARIREQHARRRA